MATPVPKPKWPWIAGAVLVAGAAGATMFMMIGGKDRRAETPGVITGPGPGTGAVEAPLPARVTISLDSDPRGADIYDDKGKVGTTPYDFELPGGREPRRFRLELGGFGGKMIELIPDENVEYRTILKKLDAGSPAVAAAAPEVEVVPQKSRRGTRPLTPGPSDPGAGSMTGSATPGSVVPGVAAGSAAIVVEGPTTTPDKPDKPDRPGLKPDKPGLKPDKPDKPDGPAVKPDGPAVKPDGPAVKPDDTPIKIKDPFATGAAGGDGAPAPTP